MAPSEPGIVFMSWAVGWRCVYVDVKFVPCLCVGAECLCGQRGGTANNRQGCWRS